MEFLLAGFHKARRYAKALETVKQGKDLDVTEFYLCPVCGFIELGKHPEICPICATLGKKILLYSPK